MRPDGQSAGRDLIEILDKRARRRRALEHTLGDHHDRIFAFTPKFAPQPLPKARPRSISLTRFHRSRHPRVGASHGRTFHCARIWPTAMSSRCQSRTPAATIVARLRSHRQGRAASAASPTERRRSPRSCASFTRRSPRPPAKICKKALGAASRGRVSIAGLGRSQSARPRSATRADVALSGRAEGLARDTLSAGSISRRYPRAYRAWSRLAECVHPVPCEPHRRAAPSRDLIEVHATISQPGHGIDADWLDRNGTRAPRRHGRSRVPTTPGTLAEMRGFSLPQGKVATLR